MGTRDRPFQPVLPVGLGFAAGAMGWMVAKELLPDALEEAPPRPVAVVAGLATLTMLLFQFLLKG
jgi:zinc transporter ZupT